MKEQTTMEHAIGSAKKQVDKGEQTMLTKDVEAKTLALVDSCGIAMLGTHGPEGYPHIKAMIKVETEGMKTIWFSTNTSSKRVAQLKENPKACVYFADQSCFKGLMLTGDMEILTDAESRQRLWKDGCEVYYPLGVTDPDYSVLRFTAKKGNYYEGLKNVSFDIE